MTRYLRFSIGNLFIILVLFSSYFGASAQPQARIDSQPIEPQYPGLATQVDDLPPSVTPEWWKRVSDSLDTPTAVGAGDYPSPDPDWIRDGYDTTHTNSFGKAVANAGDVNNDGYEDIIVGAHYYYNTGTTQGRAYIYLGSETGLSTTFIWSVGDDDPDNYAQFGRSVASAGDFNCDDYDDVIVGAHGYSGSYDGEGYVKVFFGMPTGVYTTAGWTVYGSAASEAIGSSVNTAGDVNGDNCDDIIVGAVGWDNDSSTGKEGAFFVYHGSSTPDTTHDWMIELDQGSSTFGDFSDTSGDVNGDGYDDIIIAAPDYSHVGKVWGYFGSEFGLSSSDLPDWTITLKTTSVSTAGDVNGDGYDDVVIGVYPADVNIYHGSTSGLSTTANWNVNMAFGTSANYPTVSQAGDWNNDGYGDVLIAMSTFPYSSDVGPGQYPYEGYAFLYYGSPSGLMFTPTWSMKGDMANAYLGNWEGLGSADVNNDGYDDVLLGANGQTVGGTPWVGRAYTVYGGADEAITGLTVIDDSPKEINQTISFTTTQTTGTYVTYDWDYNDGSTDLNAGTQVNHVYTSSGVYTATVIAHNTVNTQTATTLVTVQDIPIEDLEAANSSPTALGMPTYFTTTISSGTGVSYTWDLGGEVVKLGQHVSHTFSTTGVFTAVVTATNTTNQQVAETIAKVDIPISGLAATNDSPTLSGELTTFTATVSGGTGINYQWWVDGEAKDGSMVTHAYTEAGEHAAIVTATNSLGIDVVETMVLIGVAVDLPPGTESYATLQDSLSLDFPAPLTETLTITVTPQFTPTQDTGGFTFVGRSFDLSMADADGNPIIEISPTITLTLNYDDNDLPPHIDEVELTLQRYDIVLEDWVELTVIDRDMDDNWIMVELDHLTEFAILSDQPYKVFLPLVLR